MEEIKKELENKGWKINYIEIRPHNGRYSLTDGHKGPKFNDGDRVMDSFEIVTKLLRLDELERERIPLAEVLDLYECMVQQDDHVMSLESMHSRIQNLKNVMPNLLNNPTPYHSKLNLEIINWFDDKWPRVSRESIISMLSEAVKNAPIIIEDIYMTMHELHKNDIHSSIKLEQWFKWVGELSKCGIKGRRAGEALSDFFLVKKVIGQ